MRLTRRAFLQTSAVAATAASLRPNLAAEAAPAGQPWPENGMLVPDDGWHLWLDPEANWEQDPLHLPGEFRLADLPTNPPTGGWQQLQPGAAAIPVTLPGTVEQHFWGAQIPRVQNRPYTPEEYRYAADDPIPQNGAYLGVSWWFRTLEIPADMRGKRIFLHVRGARLRAEVYLNQKLVGYSIMEELPFACDLTAAARFSGDPGGGDNQLAIRITNPFGRYDWVDGLNAQWGAVKLYRSHGFGGLDRGMTLSAHGPIRIRDAWAVNRTRSRTALVSIDADSSLSSFAADALVEVVDPASGTVLSSKKIAFGAANDASCHQPLREALKPGHCEPAPSSSNLQTVELSCPSARIWSLEAPKLYDLRVTVKGPEGHTDSRTTPFGFRTFAPANIGKVQADGSQTKAVFRLNGRRIKLYSSISWGFWGLNGLWPTPSLAEKEVTQARRLNLNTLNFHRNLAKEDVLRAGDRLGLLRYLEPGAGKLAIGKLPANVQANSAGIVMEKPTTEADRFAQRYMFIKCVAMVRAFRGHTSVIQYTLQNEIGADLNNPDTLAVLAAMRAEDPSRSIVLNDGFSPPPRSAAQAWYEPWNDHLHRSDREPFAYWWNNHQGAGDQWYDEFYKSPTDFTYRAPDYAGTLTEFGEMEGCATPDNHALMLHQQAQSIDGQPPNKSYDHTDHAEIDAAYNKFLDRWGFRQAFPTTEALYKSIGQKCFDTWQNYLENARISDDLDFAVISGWESTAIENHSGIVDNLRNFKSDPTPIAATLQPVRPVAKQRSLCTALGQPATFDLYLLNDTGQPATGTLNFTAVTPTGKLLKLASFAAPAQTPDQFSYLLKEAFQTPPLNEEGMYRFWFAISSAPASMQTKEVWVTSNSLPNRPANSTGIRAQANEFRDPTKILNLHLGIAGVQRYLRTELENTSLLSPQRELVTRSFVAGQQFDVLLTSGLTANTSATQDSGDTTGLEAQPAVRPQTQATTARKLEPGEAPEPKTLGHIDPAMLDAVRAGTSLLVLAQTDALAEGCAQQLAAAGAFTYSGTVGDFRAPWMGNWYFTREHPLYAGLPQNQALGIHFQARGRQSNGLLVDGPGVEIVTGYSRDHDRHIGAGTFTCRLGKGRIVFHRVPDFHPVLQQRFLANALNWLAS